MFDNSGDSIPPYAKKVIMQSNMIKVMEKTKFPVIYFA